MSEPKTAIDLVSYNSGFDDGKRTSEWSDERKERKIKNQTLAIQRLEASKTAIRSENKYLRRLLRFALPQIEDGELKRAIEKAIGTEPPRDI